MVAAPSRDEHATSSTRYVATWVADLTEAQTQLVRRATWISIQCEELESLGVQGERIDLELFGKLD